MLKQGQGVASSSGVAKGGEKGANGKEMRSETPITMTVKRPSRPSLHSSTPGPGAPLESPRIGVGVDGGGVVAPGSYGGGNSDGMPWGVPNRMNLASPEVAVASRHMATTTPAGVHWSANVGTPTHSPGMGVMGLPGCIPQPQQPNGWIADGIGLGGMRPPMSGPLHMNGGHPTQKTAQHDEDNVVADLFISIFPGLSRDSALRISREGREALYHLP